MKKQTKTMNTNSNKDSGCGCKEGEYCSWCQPSRTQYSTPTYSYRQGIYRKNGQPIDVLTELIVMNAKIEKLEMDIEALTDDNCF